MLSLVGILALTPPKKVTKLVVARDPCRLATIALAVTPRVVNRLMALPWMQLRAVPSGAAGSTGRTGVDWPSVRTRGPLLSVQIVVVIGGERQRLIKLWIPLTRLGLGEIPNLLRCYGPSLKVC